MIPNFRGTAHIKSVYASYACEKCDNQKWVLFEEGRNLPSASGAGVPAPKCDKCGTDLEMEELEDEFFAWLDSAA
jgi:hypothetical protein